VVKENNIRVQVLESDLSSTYGGGTDNTILSWIQNMLPRAIMPAEICLPRTSIV
jgi:hypothetical protein